MKLPALFLAICVLWPQTSHGQITLGRTTVDFADVNEAKQVLTEPDEYVRSMSPFDRAARLKTDRDVSEDEYLAFVAENVLAWNDAEKQKITSAFQRISAELTALSLPFPSRVLLIKTTGNEEGNAAYTRANAIVLPQGETDAPDANLQKKICHELFHVLSRANPTLREKLYPLIGFEKCGEVAFPAELKSRKITNPDAPRNDHCIRVQVDGEARWAVPVLFSSREKYDVQQGGEFFAYLQFQLLLIQRDEVTGIAKPIDLAEKPDLVDVRQVNGFFQQAGSNTQYIIHPEEILADNFVLLVLREKDIPSPEIVEKLSAALQNARITQSSN
jgi:hypothetical protein